jgi:hypothetical protein
LKHTADAAVHALHHRREDLQRSAIGHGAVAMTGVVDGGVLGPFPRRMRRGIV